MTCSVLRPIDPVEPSMEIRFMPPVREELSSKLPHQSSAIQFAPPRRFIRDQRRLEPRPILPQLRGSARTEYPVAPGSDLSSPRVTESIAESGCRAASPYFAGLACFPVVIGCKTVNSTPGFWAFVLPGRCAQRRVTAGRRRGSHLLGSPRRAALGLFAMRARVHGPRFSQ